MTQNSSYFHQIDTLRFIAAFLVCISHWLPNHEIQYLQLGRFGVELFFVISGFLITKILLKLNENNGFSFGVLKTFFIRRILRIFPIYYFVIFITFIFHDGHFNKAVFWNLSYLSNFYMLKIEKFPGIMSHFWSLSVEEHFYLIWPFLILAFSRFKVIYTIILFGLLGVLSRYFFYQYGYSSIFPKIFTISCFDAFAIGGLMAYLFTYYYSTYTRIRDSKIIFLIVIIGMLATLYFDYSSNTQNIWDYVAFRFFASILSFYFIALSINSKSKILNNEKLVFLGKLSYSMYLFHNFIPGFLLGLEHPENIFLRLFIYFIVLFIISFLAWKLIESPFNKIKKRVLYPAIET